MCLTIGVTLLDSTTEIQLVLSSQFIGFAPVYSARASMYLRMTLVFLTALYMHIISLSVDSEAIAGLIFNLQQTATPSRL